MTVRLKVMAAGSWRVGRQGTLTPQYTRHSRNGIKPFISQLRAAPAHLQTNCLLGRETQVTGATFESRGELTGWGSAWGAGGWVCAEGQSRMENPIPRAQASLLMG